MTSGRILKKQLQKAKIDLLKEEALLTIPKKEINLLLASRPTKSPISSIEGQLHSKDKEICLV